MVGIFFITSLWIFFITSVWIFFILSCITVYPTDDQSEPAVQVWMPLPVLYDEGYGWVVPEDDKPDLPPGLQDDAVSGTDSNYSLQDLLRGCFVSLQIEKPLSLFFLFGGGFCDV